MHLSIIPYSKVKSYKEARLDAEFYKQQFLDYERVTEKIGDSFISLASIFHPKEIKREYSADGIQTILAQTIRSNYLDLSVKSYMPYEVAEEISSNKLEYDDVLLTRTGYNYAACYRNQQPDLYACADILVVRPHNIKGGYLSTYFNTKIGMSLLLRGNYGVAQPHIAPTYIKSLNIPRFGHLEDIVDDLIALSIKKDLLSQEFYRNIENDILDALNLSSWQPRHQLSFVRSYNDAQSAGRMDAGYFQPMYEEMFKLMSKEAPLVSLGDKADVIRGDHILPEYYDEDGQNYVRGTDFSKGLLSCENCIKIRNHFGDEKLNRLRVGDVVFSAIGSVGKTGFVRESEKGSYFSNNTGCIRLRDKENFNNEFIYAFLNSKLGRLQFQKSLTQTAQPKIGDSAVREFLLPQIDMNKQKRIQSNVLKMYESKDQSKTLLEIAKRGVETAIEKKEEKATDWIEKEMKKLGV